VNKGNSSEARRTRRTISARKSFFSTTSSAYTRLPSFQYVTPKVGVSQLVVGDFKCPKCGELMEHGTLTVQGSQSISVFFEREILPWKEPTWKEGEKRSKDKTTLFSTIWRRHKSEVSRCPKCSLILLGY
jgi:predicted RNA-binding Zn-ribbon protein involved in translation (DUF1610 family)